MDHSIQLYVSRVIAADFLQLETRYLPRLHTGERARYRRLMSARRRLEWLAGRALAMEGLAATLGCVNDNALCAAETGGLVYRDAALFLNLSHSRGMLALTIATTTAGVDVEQICPRALLGHVERVFTSAESAHLAQATGAERLHLFYRYWTLKEATCKAAGLSIWEGLAAARFDLRPAQAPAFTGTTEQLSGPWRFWSASIDGCWQLAIAALSAPTAGTFGAWRIVLPGTRTKLAVDAFSSFSSP
ncbi:MAG: 4'-phosphopantetheinyl transferase superfamily protein [Gammaproteobacteria bacterium]